MSKLPDCDRCKFNAHSNYLVCAVHPDGVDGDRCPDFLLDPNRKELWTPIGFMMIDEQLYRKPVTYQVDFQPTLERSSGKFYKLIHFLQVFAQVVAEVTPST